MSHTPPIVMTFAGNDPTGGAGLQADIETFASLQCRGAAVVTALTCQDSSHVIDFSPVPAEQLTAQAQAVLDDLPVAAFKIGMLGSQENILAIRDILQAHPGLPVVLDPVLASGAGESLSKHDLADAICQQLLPLTTIVTPNTLEAEALTSEVATNHDERAAELLAHGCHYVLLTGTHDDSKHVFNHFYGKREDEQLIESFQWQRLPNSYHGSGCTLASAIAALLALGMDPFTAVNEAQEYTWQALQNGYQPGKGQHFPNRFYWADEASE